MTHGRMAYHSYKKIGVNQRKEYQGIDDVNYVLRIFKTP